MKILSLQRSYFTKLFATVLLVFFCATVVCTVFLYKNNYQQMTMEKEILNQSQIYSYRQNLDTQFDSAVSFIENFRNDTNFAEYGVGKQSGQQIYKRLAQYRFLSDNLGISVGVLDRDNNICIMSDGYNKIDTQRLGLDGAEMSLNRYSMLRTGGVIPMKDGQDMDGAVFAIEQRYSNESTLW